MAQPKEHFYKTARIAVDGLDIASGEFVSVQYAGKAFDAFLTQADTDVYTVQHREGSPKYQYFASALERFCF